MLSEPSEDRAADPDADLVFASYVLSDRPGAATLMMVGELDLVTAARARVAIRRAQCDTPTLICDLGDVWFVDLAGLRVLIDATRWATRSGRRLAIANSPPIVPRMLRILQLEHALRIVAPRAETGRRIRRIAAWREQ